MRNRSRSMKICKKFNAAMSPRSIAMLQNIVTMNETMASTNSPDQKTIYKKSGKSGPTKTRVQISHTDGTDVL